EVTAEPPPANAALSAEEAEALAAIDESTPTDEVAPEGSLPEREVVYRLTPQGLHVEVLGADFSPVARAERKASGWGLILSVEATAEDPLILLSAKDGPLAFGGSVKRSSGEVERFGDRREGGGDIL